jgi:hypothetical protein
MPVYNHVFKQDKEKVRCIEKTFPEMNEACPVCEADRELKAWARERKIEGQDWERLFSGYYTQPRAFTNCISRDPEGPKDTVMFNGETVDIPKIYILGLPMKVFNDINNAINIGAEDDITDEINGSDVLITVTGSSMNTSYVHNVKKHPSPLHSDEKVRAAIIANMYNISEIFVVPNKAKRDRAVALAAGRIRILMSDTPSYTPPKTSGVDVSPIAQPTSGVGMRMASRRNNNRPRCYGNHLDNYDKCLICPWCEVCTAESDPNLTSEARLENHVRLANTEDAPHESATI